MKLPVRRALISVYDKTGLDELAAGLVESGVEIVSTGSTAARIRDLGLPVTAVEDITGFPEILGGRVKTLHPNVHAGLLADQNDPQHLDTIQGLGIEPFQLLIANLYPFRETVASGASIPETIEQIDIGGPAMVRASAKNHGSLAVVTDPTMYASVIETVRAGGFDDGQRQQLAVSAFRHTAAYDIAVAGWLGSVVSPDDDGSGFPGWIAESWERAEVLRYGENPHQTAALYVAHPAAPGIAQAEQISGKQMSYNNYVDADAARRAAYDFDEPCVAIIKHANPCGIAVAATVEEAHAKANACDPTSAFGGVIATNRTLTRAAAESIAPIFTEVVIAPDFEPEALEILTKKKNQRVLQAAPRTGATEVELRPISGGALVQAADRIDAAGDDPSTWTLATGPALGVQDFADLVFAWRAVRAVKSNAILLAHDGATVGIGMGQVNRVDSCKLAVARAGDRAAGSVAASDAFFPFDDGPQVLFEAGIKAVVQPGGSMRDADTLAAAEKAGVSVYVTGTRHFLH